jgi:hypothetical protein
MSLHSLFHEAKVLEGAGYVTCALLCDTALLYSLKYHQQGATSSRDLVAR